MFKYILFDLDGTLTNPEKGITNSVVHALKKYGIEVEDQKELRKFIGPPLKTSFCKYYGFSESEAERAIQYYREYFKDIGIFENELFSGVKELLSTLKENGKTIILATSKPEVFAKRIVEHFGLSEYFDLVVGATFDGSLGEKADIITVALEKTNIKDKSSAVMIGDRKHDILGAKINNISSIGVLFGFGSSSELQTAGADYIIESIEDIVPLIL